MQTSDDCLTSAHHSDVTVCMCEVPGDEWKPPKAQLVLPGCSSRPQLCPSTQAFLRGAELWIYSAMVAAMGTTMGRESPGGL